MTDRLKGLTVTFEHDIREDDAQGIVDAIKRLRGVAAVDGVVAGIDDHMNRVRIRRELELKLLEALK